MIRWSILFVWAFLLPYVFGKTSDVTSELQQIQANLSSIWDKIHEEESHHHDNKYSYRHSHMTRHTGKNEAHIHIHVHIEDGHDEETKPQRGPSSCNEVKRCNPNATDGEYWLYPILYGGEERVKVYCHNMTSADLATEYLTLQTTETNYIIRHDLAHTSNKRECTRNSKRLIKVSYNKVRLLINAMVVQGYDYRFTETAEGIYAPQAQMGYGEAADCSGHRWTQNCKRYGAFSIDLRNTGVTVDPSTRWKATGYHAALFNYTRSADLTQIYCLAGGWCGKCVPEDVVRLRISDEKLDDSKAANVVCK